MSKGVHIMKISYFTFILVLCVSVLAQGKTEKGKEWDLNDLYPSRSAWLKELKKTEDRYPKAAQCEKTLAQNAKSFTECLKLVTDIRMQLQRLCTWAWLRNATDVSSENISKDAQVCRTKASKFSKEVSFLSPLILKLGPQKVAEFQKQNKDLENYKQSLREIFDSKEHVLSTSEEKIVSTLSQTMRKSAETSRYLLETEIKWPKVKFSDGQVKEVNVGVYSQYRGSANRDDRQKAFKAFYNTLSQYERTFGSTLAQSVMSRNSTAQVRGYKSALDNALSDDQLPENIYRRLITEVNHSLPTLQRYLKLRKKVLGLKQQEYFDVYPSIMKSPKAFPLDETKAMTIAAVKPLGEDYVSKLKMATSKNWMSVYPIENKVSGAFMSGSAYEVHPYVLLNHRNDYSSASTYAHEWGHALHSMLANESQAFVNADYSIFIAEIAAILNEVLLNQYAVKNAKTDQERLFYLNEALESIRTTYFRQTLFAEFELAIHEEEQKTGALTGQKMSEIYLSLLRKYYGHNKGIMKIDPMYAKEWAFVPHFYSGYYVFQYSTSMAGAYYFADKILSGDKTTLTKYLTVLKQGSAKYPHEILMDAGLDLSKPNPYKSIDKMANSLMDQMEKLLKKQKVQSPT